MLPIARLFTTLGKLTRLTLLTASLIFLYQSEGKTQTCILSGTIIASNNPFAACPPGTDTIIILDTFVMDVNYEPLFNGVPYDGLLILDGGVLHFSSNASLRLGSLAKILMFNGGHVFPGMTGDQGCNGTKTIFFDMFKLASCNGFNALHSFADVNAAGCFDAGGICCNAAITIKEDSGFPNDKTLCSPGDSVTVSVTGSGSLMYDYLWTPNIGPENGPYKLAQFVNTVYSVSITGLFDPEGPEPPYLLGCSGSVTVTINPTINASTVTTPVPCASAAVGAVDLTVTGGTAPYKYAWSNNLSTQDINGLTAGTYTVTITDAKGCVKIISAVVITQDNTPPTLSCPANAAGIAQPGLCTTTIPNINATFSDNCPAAALTYEITGATTANGSGQLSNVFPFQSGVNTVKYLVSDGSNTVSCNFTVTVTDNQLPTASNPPVMTGVQCFEDLPAPDPSVVTTEADNCGTPTVTYINQSVIGGLGCPINPLIVSRRYRVTDAAGNSITVTQQIQVADDTPPSFTSVPTNTTVSCQSIPAVGTASATDNCTGSVTVTYLGETRTNGSCPDTYTLTRTWRATDNCGNTSTATQLIAVQDVISPVFNLVPPNVTVNCDAVPIAGSATATDNCDAAVTITYLGEQRTDGSCPNAYTLSRSWRAEDNCGNSTTAQQIITVVDVTKPTFTAVPANVTVTCESIPAVGSAAANDNCDASVTIAYMGETRTNGACADSYTLTRTWSATDDCGNTATATQLITVQDLVAPNFLTVPANVTVSCDAVPAPGTPTANDNCDTDVTVTFDGETRVGGVCPYTYTLTRTWTASDNCGNTKTTTQVITVQDLENPTFTSVPANVTVTCTAIPALGSATATDNCDPTVVVAYIGETRVDGPCADTYTLLRRWRATDRCGNTSTAEQVITVQDLEAPVFTFVPVAVTVTCESIPAAGAPTATDNCDATVTITYNGETRTNGNCANNYTLTRTWTAADNCGNTTTATQLITVQDLTAPVFTFVPVNVTASCEALPAVGTPTASDNCTPSVTITYLGENIPGSGGGSCLSNYEIIRTWQATDECGNTTTASQTITVQDITSPVVTFVPADTTVSCSGIPPVGTPAATDNCDASLTITYTGANRINGACPNSYTLQRNWTIADDCGNTSTAMQTITVVDQTAPVFTSVPAPVTVSCESIPPVDTPEATDNCAAAVTITYNGAVRTDGACLDSYTLERSWTAADSCGNTSIATQIITVQDITPPVFIFVPADATVECSDIPPLDFPRATDNCDISVSITYLGEQRTDGNCPYNYTLTRSWVAEDNCGNIAEATQVLTVRDITAPVFTFVPVPVTVNCDAIPAVGTPTATDNCDPNVNIIYLGEGKTNGNCSGNYTLLRTWVAQDACSNFTITTQLITVQDITSPVVTSVPAAVTVSCDAIPAVGTPTATDNCDTDLSITYDGATRVNGLCPNSYTLTRHWTITDDCGNTATASQVITVEDLTAPVFTFVPSPTTVSCEAIPAVETPMATDNCAALVSITYNGAVRTDGACPDSYTLSRSWTAVDSCGNSSIATQIITVQDVTPPNYTMVPADVTVNCETIPPVEFPTAVDNCDQFVSIAYSGQTKINGNCTHSYILKREWTATDNCGNTSTTTQTITVQDITPPQFLTVPANITVSCEAVPAAGTPTAADNCDADVDISYSGEERTDGNCPNNYTLKRTWLATDDCGNTKTAFQTIKVEDLTKPVFTFVPADTTVNCNDIPFPGNPVATDNCTTNPVITFVGETVMSSNSPDSYTVERKWTATDECNNVAIAVQLLEVQDTVAPAITCPDNIDVDANGATCSAVVDFNDPLTADNCGATLSVTSTATSGQSFGIGTTLVTMQVSDPTGNSSTCTFEVVVRDTTPPVLLNCPADLTVTTAPTSCQAQVNWTAPSVTDPCDQYAITPTPTIVNGAILPTGIHQVVYTAVDSSGNSSQCSFVVTVREDIVPVLTNCPTDITVNTVVCTAEVSWTPPGAFDNCELDTVFVNIEPGSTFQETTTLVQYTAVDEWGNTATCTFNVTVVDQVPPVFSGCPDNIELNAGVCFIPVSWTQPTATDNCDPDPTVYSIPEPGSAFPAGFTT
ncbi:MAG: HYR domain-containing protein, partial [Saprospiraceae bacterium]|nr:HYR domain-containing protein [Saprospiraceae bacterium]